MDKTALGLVAALGAVVPLGTALASTPPDGPQRALHATSIAELLEPVPNAVDVMKATETERSAQAEQQQKLAQIIEFGHHHHHHHHRRFFFRHHHHHHHHHHHWRWHHHY
jgi:hypothetical protein